MSDDELLARIRRYREAARTTVRTPGVSDRDRCLALLQLADMARDEEDPTIRTWAERATWEEAKGFLGLDDAAPPLPSTSFERKVRTLRHEGLVRCDRCGHDLPTDEERSSAGRGCAEMLPSSATDERWRSADGRS